MKRGRVPRPWSFAGGIGAALAIGLAVGLAVGFAVSLVQAGDCGTGDRGVDASDDDAGAAGEPAIVVAGCDDAATWSAHPADGVALSLTGDAGVRGRALRLDFRFDGGGWAIARREVDLDLPANYAFRFFLRGEAPVNHLEFKLIDTSGENVWWHVWRDIAWPEDWTRFTVRKRQIDFAWGPSGGGELRHVAAIEFAVTAGAGGSGTVWLDELVLEPRQVVTGPPPQPVAIASSAAEGHAASLAVDGDGGTFWAAARADTTPTLVLDLGRLREYGGLAVDWVPERHATAYVVEASDTAGGDAWRKLARVVGSNGGRDRLYLPDSESRRLRLRVTSAGGGASERSRRTGAGIAIAEVGVEPSDGAESREAFVAGIAREARRGLYPRGFLDEPTAWTVVGVDADAREGLLSADGAVESGPDGFSVEPFLEIDGELVTWADVVREPSLARGDLPIPSLAWLNDGWRLEVKAFGTGTPGASSAVVQYALARDAAGVVTPEKSTADPDTATLYLAVRPFQVNPPAQFLNLRRGVAPMHAIERRGDTILVDGDPRLYLRREPDAFGASTYQGGDIVAEHLARGTLPAADRAVDPDDPIGLCSAAVAYRVAPALGETATVAIVLPLHEGAHLLSDGPDADVTVADGSAANRPTPDVSVDLLAAKAVAAWSAALDRVTITGPAAAADALATVRAQLGYILVNRAGPAIQPGARAYARSWIRDGALTGEALLRLGHREAVRDFLEWFAPHQYENGKIPCVVDRRGADPVPEHDSTGEFIHLVTQYYRYTGDRALLDAMWPRVVAGVRYLNALLDERRTAAYRTPDQRPFYGILPPSISHEGYSAKPMHSYWDDFWALRGFADAAWLAGELAPRVPTAVVEEMDAATDRFAADLGASVVAAMEVHGIDYVPGCADLGDFDPTSTTIALSPTGAAAVLPDSAVERTFARYWEFFTARRGGEPWEAFTPYEIRNIGAFVRLGWRERANELREWFLAHRQPAGWRQWPEVVWNEGSGARFVGDMPHTWVGSDYVRSVLDMFVYERSDGIDRQGGTLVLAAGIPAAWLDGGGVSVARLPTPYGTLDYRLWREDGEVIMEIGGDIAVPPGGLVPMPPGTMGRTAVTESAATVDQGGAVTIAELPTRIVWTR